MDTYAKLVNYAVGADGTSACEVGDFFSPWLFHFTGKETTSLYFAGSV